MTFLFFIFSLGELQYLNLESNSLDHLPKNLLHKNVHKKLLDVRLSYNKLRIVDTNTFSSLKVKLMTCFHEFSKYEITIFPTKLVYYLLSVMHTVHLISFRYRTRYWNSTDQSASSTFITTNQSGSQLSSSQLSRLLLLNFYHSQASSP